MTDQFRIFAGPEPYKSGSPLYHLIIQLGALHSQKNSVEDLLSKIPSIPSFRQLLEILYGYVNSQANRNSRVPQASCKSNG